MATSTQIKETLNSILRPANIRLDTWTAADRERERIKALQLRGALSEPVYPLTGGMERFDPTGLAQAYANHRDGLLRLKAPEHDGVGYEPENDYFASPDSDVLYLLVRSLQPRRVIEVGCGNSTRVTRQAILDAALPASIVAIDPSPRIDLTGVVDCFEQTPLEEIDIAVFQSLERNDILFIDSSHQVFVGNDVAHLFCKVIPALKPGVVVHVHDVFLPYDYPETFAFEYPHWGEQYVLHALVNGRDCEVLWPGHHVQRDRHDLHNLLPFVNEGVAQSFWFRWS